jgi:hypothetical protein
LQWKQSIKVVVGLVFVLQGLPAGSVCLLLGPSKLRILDSPNYMISTATSPFRDVNCQTGPETSDVCPGELYPGIYMLPRVSKGSQPRSSKSQFTDFLYPKRKVNCYRRTVSIEASRQRH